MIILCVLVCVLLCVFHFHSVAHHCVCERERARAFVTTSMIIGVIVMHGVCSVYFNHLRVHASVCVFVCTRLCDSLCMGLFMRGRVYAIVCVCLPCLWTVGFALNVGHQNPSYVNSRQAGRCRQAEAGRREGVALGLGSGGAGGARPSRAPREVERDGKRERSRSRRADRQPGRQTDGQEGT